MIPKKLSILAALFIAAALVLAACGGGGGGGTPDTEAPTVPTGLSATPVSTSRIDLTWDACTDSVGVTGYEIYRGGTLLNTVTGTTASDTGLSESTNYCYTVLAYDAAGNESAQSAQACATTGSSSDTTAPSVPTDLSATAASSSQINLSWTASTDDTSVAGYKIYRGGVYLKNAPLTAASDAGLSASTNYCYTVSAFDAAGNESAQSAQACATTQAGTGSPPNAPSGLAATATSSTSIALTWTDNSTDETGFYVERSSPTCADTFTQIASVSAEVQGYTDTGRSPSTAYCYRVRAYNGNGNSAYSATASATTQATPSHTLTVSKAGDGTGTVTGSGINCGTTCTQSIADGTVVTLTAAPDSGSMFSSWSGCDSASGTTCNVTMDQDKTVTATFGVAFSLSVEITGLPSTSSDGNYTLQWACSGLCSNVSVVHEDVNTSFSNPSSYQFIGGERSMTFTNKANGTYCYRVSVGGSAWSAPECITVASPTSATLRIINNTHYPMIDIRLNGVQQAFDPYGIAAGQSFDFVFTSPGTVSLNLGVGFYDSYGYRDIWFTFTGSTSVTTGNVTTVTVENPTIGDLLSQFNPAGHYWDGQYWCYSCNPIVGYASFLFKQNGSWTFYDNDVQAGSGTLTLVEWNDYSTYVKFKICSTCEVITIWYPFASFMYSNGPADWPIIEYVIR